MTLSRDTIITLGNKLSPAAVTLNRLRMLLLDPKTELDEIVQLIRLDAALTFHVVRMSNTVLFGMRERTDSLEHAVGRVGLGEVFRLVSLAATRQVCQRDLLAYRVPAKRLWENAIATAAAAEGLAHCAGRDAGLAYTAGLMRTIGRVVLDGASFGRSYPGEAEWPSVTEWEKQTFGMTAAEVSTIILDHWRFPGDLVESVRDHLDPLSDPISSNVGACLLNLACGVATSFGLELPGEQGNWVCTPAKLTLAGVNEADMEECSDRARTQFQLVCASVS